MFSAMIRSLKLPVWSALLLCTRLAVGGNELQCHRHSLGLAPDEPPTQRQYAPDREIDVLHLALDVTPDFKQRTVAGTATMRFKPIGKPLRELKLDAVDLTVESVTSPVKIQAHQVTADQIIVTFAEPIAAGQEASVAVRYRAQPRKGLYFRTPEMGYPPGDTHLYTQGETIEARHWFPSFDSPNEKFTTEITCRVPEGMIVLSNGRKISEERDPATGLVAVRWLQDKPHVNYLISLAAGHFKKVEDRHRDIPMAFWTPASEIDQAMNSFRDTKDMMTFLESEIGVPYPWAKYDQVCVTDFGWGGMENTSITTLNANTLFTSATENIRSSQGLLAHELAHQWFGDLVTCKDWSHIWLNEGFATYYETLYEGHKNGRDAMLDEFHTRAKSLTANPDDPNPMVSRKFDSPDDMFRQYGYLAYGKGSWVLRMLRAELGDDLFRRSIKTWLERHQYDTVVTEDLRAAVEEVSGRSFDRFFDQWVYHGGSPNLEINYSWNEVDRLARVSVRQTQKIGDDVLLFQFPLTIRFKTKSGAVDRTVTVREREEDFHFPLAEAPELVRIDPNLELLARINFNPPLPMLHAQLADTNDVIGRLIAVEQLGKRKDHESVAKLKEALNRDPYWGVRRDASRGLRSIHSDAALEALLASTRQSDARVRRQVVDDVADFYRDAAYADALRVLNSEQNPDILAAAIEAIAGFAKPEVKDQLLKFLNSESYRNALAHAAIDAIRLQDDPAFILPLKESLAARESAFTSRGFGSALDTLAYLARNEENRDEVRQFLVRHVNSPREPVQVAAIRALGTLGDPRAIAVVEKFATAGPQSPVRTAANAAVASLRTARKPVDDFKNLRGEVTDLQKHNQELRKELDDLKKKVEATSPVSATDKSKKKPAPSRSR